MFVALSRFAIRSDMAEQVREAFCARPHLVDTALGFLGTQVMSPIDNASEIWPVTRWVDEQSYRIWHASHAYHDSHSGIPKGLKSRGRGGGVAATTFCHASPDMRCIHAGAGQFPT